jgi:hypothetical protein
MGFNYIANINVLDLLDGGAHDTSFTDTADGSNETATYTRAYDGAIIL